MHWKERGYITPSRRGACFGCGKVIQVTHTSAAEPRCLDCRRAGAAVPGPAPDQHWVCAWCEEACSRPAARGQVPKYCGTVCAGRAASHRRAERRGEFSLSRAQRRRLFERDGYVCRICGTATSKVWAADDPRSPTLDHIVPRSVSVDDSPENLRTAHAFCNSVRSDDRRTDAEVRALALARFGL